VERKAANGSERRLSAKEGEKEKEKGTARAASATLNALRLQPRWGGSDRKAIINMDSDGGGWQSHSKLLPSSAWASMSNTS